ncbi:MAG: Crp/Fnr family transcriptional regulator [Chlorobi bacterium]|nr:Crp/Fnr family transcriptional regulator [Chlorobiota bacterium]MCI0715154.1 Crp/Fnr family transcriptional regulator [Chlorobiota bacterium]
MAKYTGLEEIIKNYKDLIPLVFHKNELLFQEGESAKGIYCIESGNVKLSKKEANDGDRIVHLAAKGEILGLHAVVNRHNYTNSAVALTKTHSCFITADDFLKLIEDNNTYKLLVMKSLCSRIDTMENHINRISDKPSDERFADTLLMLVNKYGLNRSRELNIHLSLDEIASFTCTSKSYMKKIISDFSQRGLISFSGGIINIRNLPQLENIVNLSSKAALPS